MDINIIGTLRIASSAEGEKLSNVEVTVRYHLMTHTCFLP